MAFPTDPQLPRRHGDERPSGLEPALPGNSPAFDPIWLMVREILRRNTNPLTGRSGGEYDAWFAAVVTLLIPVLRENRLGTRDEPIRVTIYSDWAVDEWETHAEHWYFDPWADISRQCIDRSADQREAVGTQLGAWVALSVSWCDAAGGECRLKLYLRRFGAGPDGELCTEHTATRTPEGQWLIGPGRASPYRLSDLPQ